VRPSGPRGGAGDKMASEDICNELHEMEGHPWGEFGRAKKQITKNQLARLLKDFRITPENLRIGQQLIYPRGPPKAPYRTSR
jgi:uncharacterized protein DUF3631